MSDFIDNSIVNLLKELKKRIFVKIKIVDGMEKAEYEFEAECKDLVSGWLKSALKNAVAIQKPTHATIKPELTVQKIDPPKTESEPKQEQPKQEIKKEEKSSDAPPAVQKETLAILEKLKQNSALTAAISVDAAPEKDPPMPPGYEEKKVGELKDYLSQNKLPLLKTPEWYSMKFASYDIPESFYKESKNLNALHRRWIGGIDANNNFIRWQYAWLVYNHQNGKNIFENTFVVDKSRITKECQEDLKNGTPVIKTQEKASSPEPRKKIVLTSPAADAAPVVSSDPEDDTDPEPQVRRKPSVIFE